MRDSIFMITFVINHIWSQEKEQKQQSTADEVERKSDMLKFCVMLV